MSITSSVNHDLLSWFATLPIWQNEAFRKINAKGKLDTADIEALAALTILEHSPGTVAADLPARLGSIELPTVPAAPGATPPRLMALHSLENVNMLAANQRVEFGPALTVIYGGNGAGKSGYARVLKKACRCNEQAIEPVLKNVYAPVASAGGVSTAKFDIEIGGATSTIAWQDGVTHSANDLKYFAVFDSKAARQFIAAKNEVPAPSVFAKLEDLGEAIKQTKELLGRMAAKEDPVPNALSPYIDVTPTGKLIESITNQTTKAVLEAALVWTESDEAKITDLEQQQATIKTNGPQALQKQLQQRLVRVRLLRSEIRKISTVLNDESIALLKKQWAECKALTEAKRLAAEKALGLSVIDGAGSSAWEDLLKAAALYYEKEIGEAESVFPGKEGESRCVLCQETLEGDAYARLKSFWQFMTDTAAVRLESAQGKMAEMLKPFIQIPASIPANLISISNQFTEEIPAIWILAQAYFLDGAILKEKLLKLSASGNWDDNPDLPNAPIALCDGEEAALLDQESKLDDPVKAAAAVFKLATDIRDLSARKRASTVKKTFTDHLEKLTKAQALRNLATGISTVTVSNKSKALNKQYITDAFIKSLKDEAKALGLKRAVPGLNPETKSGKTTHAVTIEGARFGTPESVFSEGERTALALSYFIVDIGTPIETPCAIFDDPVSSLDHRIRSRVVDRLCALAATRQVAVFTHDLPFFCELKDKSICVEVNLKKQAIETAGVTTGVVRDGDPVDAMSVTERELLLERIIKNAKEAEMQGKPELLSNMAHRFYSLLRSTWERSVEELLFNKVVQRYEKEVKTLRLTEAVVDAASIATVFTAMTKCSGKIDGHDSAIALNADIPDGAEMSDDLKLLREFRVEHAKKRKAQKELLKHLA